MSDLVPVDPATEIVPAQPLVVSKTTPVLEEANKSMLEVCKLYQQRLANGVTATIQAGPRMRLLQELFGTPFNVQIQAAVIAKKPANSMPPEPLISRKDAPLLKEVYQLKDKETFAQTKWTPYNTTHYGKKRSRNVADLLWMFSLPGGNYNLGTTVESPH